MNRLRKNIKGQSTIEFTFAVIVIMFLIYGMMRVFRWVGMDLAQRRVAEDLSLTSDVTENAENPTGDPAVQFNSDFYRIQSIDAVYNGSITNGNGQ